MSAGWARLRATWPLTRRVRRWVAAQPPPDPTAFAAFGAGSWVVPPCAVVGPDRISVGAEVVVLEHGGLLASPGARLALGDGARLGRAVQVRCTVEVVIEEEVATSDDVTITDTWGVAGYEPARLLPTPAAAPVRIGRGAYLGCGSVVGPGVHVGAGAYVGEGAVVVADVPAHTVVRGNPAAVVVR